MYINRSCKISRKCIWKGRKMHIFHCWKCNTFWGPKVGLGPWPIFVYLAHATLLDFCKICKKKVQAPPGPLTKYWIHWYLIFQYNAINPCFEITRLPTLFIAVYISYGLEKWKLFLILLLKTVCTEMKLFGKLTMTFEVWTMDPKASTCKLKTNGGMDNRHANAN